jgi:hypothetical protein
VPDRPPSETCASAWRSGWSLLGADPSGGEGGAGAPAPELAEPVWSEHFYTLDALCRRILGPPKPVAGATVAPDPSAAPLASLRQRRREGLLSPDDVAAWKSAELAKPDTLLVRGPLDGAAVPWPQHPVVCARVRALALPSGGARSTPGLHYEVTTTDPIFVKVSELKALISAMLRRPLILLAGVSGSGKTQLAKRLGKAWAVGAFHGRLPLGVGAIVRQPNLAVAWQHLVAVELIRIDPRGWCSLYDIGDAPALADRYAFTAVRSDWTEASHLWGHHIPLPAEAQGFYGTNTLWVFLQAHLEFQRAQGRADPSPHFVLLDEMNLSRPEHFASDLLSAMEVQLGTEQRADVIELHKAGDGVRLRREGASGVTVPERIGWAPALRVVGTVNVDETTFSFAPKVLDRAALLEFVDVDLERVLGADPTFIDFQDWFDVVNGILAPHNLHIAYRAAREIVKALELAGPDDQHDELDRQLCHKILPRVRGTRTQVEPILIALRERVCGVPLEPSERDNLMKGVLPEEPSEDWPMSVKKIDQMLQRAYATGFTSFFG